MTRFQDMGYNNQQCEEPTSSYSSYAVLWEMIRLVAYFVQKSGISAMIEIMRFFFQGFLLELKQGI